MNIYTTRTVAVIALVLSVINSGVLIAVFADYFKSLKQKKTDKK